MPDNCPRCAARREAKQQHADKLKRAEAEVLRLGNLIGSLKALCIRSHDTIAAYRHLIQRPGSEGYATVNLMDDLAKAVGAQPDRSRQCIQEGHEACGETPSMTTAESHLVRLVGSVAVEAQKTIQPEHFWREIERVCDVAMRLPIRDDPQ